MLQLQLVTLTQVHITQHQMAGKKIEECAAQQEKKHEKYRSEDEHMGKAPGIVRHTETDR